MTELFKKRLELLAKLGTIEVSKNGNHFVVLNQQTVIVLITFGIRSVSKNTLHKLGKETTYPRVAREVVMLTSDNKLKYKPIDREHFVPVTCGLVRRVYALHEIYMFNKRSEYLKNYDISFMTFYNYLRSFKSMKEAFAHLGVTAKVEFTASNLEKLILGHTCVNKTVLLEANLDTFKDCLSMAERLGIDISKNQKSFENLHDDLVDLTNLEDAGGYSDDRVVPVYFEKFLKKLELCDATVYTSKRQMFVAGRKFANCISSRDYRLPIHMFFSIMYQDKPVIFEIDDNKIIEAKGKYNTFVAGAEEFISDLLGIHK